MDHPKSNRLDESYIDNNKDGKNDENKDEDNNEYSSILLSKGTMDPSINTKSIPQQKSIDTLIDNNVDTKNDKNINKNHGIIKHSLFKKQYMDNNPSPNSSNQNLTDTNIHHPHILHHHSLANLLPNSTIRNSIASFSNHSDISNRTVSSSSSSLSPSVSISNSNTNLASNVNSNSNSNSNIPLPQASLMGRSVSTPYQQQQQQQQQINHQARSRSKSQFHPHQQSISQSQSQLLPTFIHSNTHQNYSNSSQSPPDSIHSVTTTSSTITSVKNSKRKLFNFTKKATRIAGDIAFGRHEDNATDFWNSNTYFNNSSRFHPQLRSDQFENKQLLIEYNSKLKNIINLTKDHSMLFYIDYLRFFLKYMDDSEFDDPILYSITRNTFWNNWYIKYLKSIDSILDEKLKNNNNTNNININNISQNNEENTKETNISTKSSSNDIKLKISKLPSIDKIDSELFQDRRIILILLWQNQIINRLSNQSSILLNLLSKQTLNSEICIITSNKLKSFIPSPDESLPKLFKNHISPSYFELIDGWKLRHDFSNFKTNLINLSDRFQIFTDFSKSGYLPIDLQQQYPHFNDFIFLTNEFKNSKLNSNEKKFLSNYSSFTAPSIHKLPLKDNSQSLIYLPDFSRLISNENDIKTGLNEFNRILKPGGSIFLTLFDIKSFKNSKTASFHDHHVYLGEYIQIFINNEISKYSKLPNLSHIIINYLREKGFKNIKFVKLGLPIINYQDQQFDYENLKNLNEISDDSIDKIKSKINNLNNINDQSILSLYSMSSSFIDFLRISEVFNLNSWISNPNKNLNLNDDLINVLKLWLNWKIHGFRSKSIRDKIVERIKTKFDNDGYDSELGVKINCDFWESFKERDFTKIESYIDENYGLFNDGILAGLDCLFLLTADKGLGKDTGLNGN